MAFGNRGFGRGGGFNREFRPRFKRELTKIKCSECGKEDEVPFKPSGDRPVFCRDCFMKKKGITPRRDFRRERADESQESETEDLSEENSKEEDTEEI